MEIVCASSAGVSSAGVGGGGVPGEVLVRGARPRVVVGGPLSAAVAAAGLAA